MLKVMMLAVMLFLVSCSTIGKYANIEGLSPESYAKAKQYVELGVSYSISQLIDFEIISNDGIEILDAVQHKLVYVATNPVLSEANDLITEAISEIPILQEYVREEYVMAIVEFAENWIAENGGFNFVAVEGRTYFSERTQGLILAIASGIRGGISDMASITDNNIGGLAYTALTPQKNVEIGFRRASNERLAK